MCNFCNTHVYGTFFPTMKDGNIVFTKCSVNQNIPSLILPVCYYDQSVSDFITAPKRSQEIPRTYHDSTIIVCVGGIYFPLLTYHKTFQSSDSNVVAVKLQFMLITEVFKEKERKFVV